MPESRKFLFVISFIGLFLLMGTQLKAQTEGKRVLQLSGIILGEDSVSGLPGVHVYVPRRMQGTTSNYLGFFSLPVLEGDSLVFSSVGYQRQHYIVPKGLDKQVTLVVEMVSDTTYLENVTIMPFPTEEIFKEAILALNLPEDEEIDETRLSQELLAIMMQSVPMDAETNYRYYMDQMIYNQTYRYGIRPNPLLNPFNWAKFIKSLKERNKK